MRGTPGARKTVFCTPKNKIKLHVCVCTTMYCVRVCVNINNVDGGIVLS